MASNESINFGNIGPDTSSIITPKSNFGNFDSIGPNFKTFPITEEGDIKITERVIQLHYLLQDRRF